MEEKLKEEIKNVIKGFIIKTFKQGKGSLRDNDSLFENNIIDSFGILELISFIEKKFSVSINPSEVTIENFDSLDKIVKLIEGKRKK